MRACMGHEGAMGHAYRAQKRKANSQAKRASKQCIQNYLLFFTKSDAMFTTSHPK